MLHLNQVCLFVVVQEMVFVCSMELPENAILRADGKVIGVGGQHKASMMRRHSEESTSPDQMASFTEFGQSDKDKEMMDKFFKSMANPTFTRASLLGSRVASHVDMNSTRKKRRTGRGYGGDDGDGWSIEDEIARGGLKTWPAPSFPWHEEWLGNKMELLQDNCAIAVGEDKGYSDYGRLPHSCAMCTHECNHANRQQNVAATWTIEPSLADEPAKAFHFYTIMENIDGLGCTNCLDWKDSDAEEIGISHNYEIDFSSTKDYTDIPDFKSLIGTYVSTGTGTEFAGKLFVLVRDTAPPKNIDGCTKNAPGRRYALKGAARDGELFYCQRFCTIPHEEGGCPCGFMDAIGCAVHVHVATSMMIKFNVRVVADDAMAPLMGEDGHPKSLGGQQWEVLATFGHDEHDKKEIVVGRVVLTGNGEDEGVVALKQNVHHKGCTPCDMFYASFVSVGPFVTSPAGAHWVRSADVVPPVLTEDSCELFRVTAKQGHVLLFESGPGIWPVTQAEATLFTCPQPSGNQTR